MKVCVYEKDMFPAFRLFAVLRQRNIIVQGPSVRLLPKNAWSSESQTIQKAKYARLITLNWLQDLPLWNCVTTVGSNDISNASNLFGRWLYSVRQIVALFHEGFAHWDTLTCKFLAHCHLVDSATAPNLSNMSMMEVVEVVEHVVDVVARAMYCRLYRRADYSDDDRGAGPFYGYRSDWADLGKPGEFAILHFVKQYQKEVDLALRQVLGEIYEKWELEEDLKPIPGHLVL